LDQWQPPPLWRSLPTTGCAAGSSTTSGIVVGVDCSAPTAFYGRSIELQWLALNSAMRQWTAHV
jgi:hypothetical protein